MQLTISQNTVLCFSGIRSKRPVENTRRGSVVELNHPSIREKRSVRDKRSRKVQVTLAVHLKKVIVKALRVSLTVTVILVLLIWRNPVIQVCWLLLSIRSHKRNVK